MSFFVFVFVFVVFLFLVNTWNSLLAQIYLIKSDLQLLISIALVNMQMTCGDFAPPAHISISFIVTGITFVIVNSTICSHHLIQVG